MVEEAKTVTLDEVAAAATDDTRDRAVRRLPRGLLDRLIPHVFKLRVLRRSGDGVP